MAGDSIPKDNPEPQQDRPKFNGPFPVQRGSSNITEPEEGYNPKKGFLPEREDRAQKKDQEAEFRAAAIKLAQRERELDELLKQQEDSLATGGVLISKDGAKRATGVQSTIEDIKGVEGGMYRGGSTNIFSRCYRSTSPHKKKSHQ